MTTNAMVLDMLGEELSSAVVAAQGRLSDDTIIARCNEGLWLVERGGVTVHGDLTYAEAITHVAGLS